MGKKEPPGNLIALLPDTKKSFLNPGQELKIMNHMKFKNNYKKA